jgi:hypothetical protein
MVGTAVYIVDKAWDRRVREYLEGGKWPGPSCPLHLVEDFHSNTLFDPTPSKNSLGLRLYQTAQLGASVVFKTHKQWAAIRRFFGGFEVKRHVQSMGDYYLEADVELHGLRLGCFLAGGYFEVDASAADTGLDLYHKMARIGGAERPLFLLGRSQAAEFVASCKEGHPETQLLEQLQMLQPLGMQELEGKVLFVDSEGIVPLKADLPRCNHCGRTDSLRQCECLKVHYCSGYCQYRNRKVHLEDCKLDPLRLKRGRQRVFKQVGARQGLVGLGNLGNTCYINSAIQALARLPEFEELFKVAKLFSKVNYSNPLGYKGELVFSFAELLRQLWTTDKAYFYPNSFKRTLRKLHPEYGDGRQQDSNEFLEFLLQGIHEDIKEQPVSPHKSTVAGENEAAASMRHWSNFIAKNKSLVSRQMMGQLAFKILCSNPECEHRSVSF